MSLFDISGVEDWIHPVSFYFRVVIDGLATAFNEVSGIETTVESERVVSGGDDSHCYYVPTKKTYGDLVLKRGMLKVIDPFFLWCKECIIAPLIAGRIKPKTVVVMLLDEMKLPVASWTFNDAYPVKWSLGAFNAEKSEIAIETVSLKYYSMDVN